MSTPSPDGRLLAVAMGGGVRLWDLPARREVAVVPCGSSKCCLFEVGGRALLTCSERLGLLRWPIRESGANPAELSLGPPESIKAPFAPQGMVGSHDISTLAIASDVSGGAVVNSKASTPSLVVPHPGCSYVAITPDAKWLATSGWHSDRVRLWNAHNGELAWEQTVFGGQTRVFFTPDSRQLIVSRGNEFTFLDVNSLQFNRRLRRDIGLYPGDVAFSPDSKLMAVEMTPGLIHLKDASGERTIAQLEDPFADRSAWITFGADGTKLITVSPYSAAIHVWDLRAIRVRLKAMGLDWDWPEFAPAQESLPSVRLGSLKVEVISTAAQTPVTP